MKIFACREVGAKAAQHEHGAHLVSGELEEEAMSELEAAAANKLKASYTGPQFFFAYQRLNTGGGVKPYFVYR
jgi:hypothetical protein